MAMSRPDSKNVFYFPHYTKSTSELDLIEHKYNSEGYKAYYKLQELVADADYHRLSLATEDEKDMFDLGMNCKQEVVDDVIRIHTANGAGYGDPKKRDRKSIEADIKNEYITVEQAKKYYNFDVQSTKK